MVTPVDNFRFLHSILEEYPQIQIFSKFFNFKEFYPINMVVVSQPQGYENILIYGLFVVDINAVKNGGGAQIKQDFIEINVVTKKCFYYSGIPKKFKKSPTLRPISEFCKKFGTFENGELGQYGVYLNGNQKLTTNHHYSGADDKNLPSEPEFRQAASVAINYVTEYLKVAISS